MSRQQSLEKPNNTDIVNSLDKTTKELIVDSLYTGRGHQQAGLRYSYWNNRIGIPATIISALASSGAALTAIFGAWSGLTASLAILATIATALRAFLRWDKIADDHALKGRRYISLRNDVRIFRDIDLHLFRNLGSRSTGFERDITT